MSDNDNIWKQPEAPPPPLFTGKKEKDLVKQVTDELTERVIKSEVVYYPVSLKHSNYHSLYGEAVEKSFLPPVHISTYVEREQEQTTANNFGLDKKSSITIHFHKRRITEDKNLFVREGDFVLYGEHFYEIVALGQPRLLFGQIDSQIEIVATCIRARDGVFPEQKKSIIDAEDDPRLTSAPCDPINELNVLDGTGTSTGGSGDTPAACEEISKRPLNPPPPLFTGQKETNLVKQVSDEILERVIGQQVVYFPVSVGHSAFHNLYGEAVNKTFLPPLRIYAAVSWEGSDTTYTNLGVDRRSQITVRFHKRRLSEDQNLFVREGDFVLYGKILYEITTVGQPRQLFGQVDQKFEVVATCIRSREGVFKLSQQKVDGKILDMTTTELCDNANLVTGDGEVNTGRNIGAGSGIFSQKVGKELQFKSLVAGSNINISSDASEITIASSATLSGSITNALTASHILGSGVEGIVATATNATNAVTAQTASYVVTAQTASYYAEKDTLQSVTSRGATTTGALSVAGLSSSLNISASGFYGDGTNLTGVVAEWDGSHTGNATIQGNLSSSAVITATRFIGDGSSLTGVTAEWDGSHTGNATIQGNLSASSAITAGTFTGNGAALTNIAAANVVGTVATATSADMVDGKHSTDFNLNYVTQNGATTTNALGVGSLSASMNVSASAYYGDGSKLTGISTASTLDEVTDNGNSTTNNITVGNIIATQITGSLTKLRNGNPYLVAGSNITIVTGSDGQLTISATGGGGAASTIVSVGNGVLTIADDGPGGVYRSLLNKYHVSASSYSSKIIYLAATGSSPVDSFKIPRKFYFNENGVWHPSPFFTFGAALASTASVEMPDLHDILHLNGSDTEDRAVLTGFYNNSSSFSGRVVYVSNTGSPVIGPFTSQNKYYFNESGIWFKSPFAV
jgi:hypothetical protein